MRTREDLEKYLLASAYTCEEVADGTWLLQDPSQPEDRIVLREQSGLLVYRLKVLDRREIADAPGLYQRLLELNASDMAHGAYALADGHVVLTSAGRVDTLDPEELQSTVDDFVLAVQSHRTTLKGYCA